MADAVTISEPPTAVEAPPAKSYDQKQYNKNFCAKHINRIREKTTCDVCCGTYTYFNKSKHLKTRKHLAIAAARAAERGSSA